MFLKHLQTAQDYHGDTFDKFLNFSSFYFLFLLIFIGIPKTLATPFLSPTKRPRPQFYSIFKFFLILFLNIYRYSRKSFAFAFTPAEQRVSDSRGTRL